MAAPRPKPLATNTTTPTSIDRAACFAVSTPIASTATAPQNRPVKAIQRGPLRRGSDSFLESRRGHDHQLVAGFEDDVAQARPNASRGPVDGKHGCPVAAAKTRLAGVEADEAGRRSDDGLEEHGLTAVEFEQVDLFGAQARLRQHVGHVVDVAHEPQEIPAAQHMIRGRGIDGVAIGLDAAQLHPCEVA